MNELDTELTNDLLKFADEKSVQLRQEVWQALKIEKDNLSNKGLAVREVDLVIMKIGELAIVSTDDLTVRESDLLQVKETYFGCPHPFGNCTCGKRRFIEGLTQYQIFSEIL